MFIKLTEKNTSEIVLINFDHVASIKQYGTSTSIMLVSGNQVLVQERLSEFDKYLVGHEKR